MSILPYSVLECPYALDKRTCTNAKSLQKYLYFLCQANYYWTNRRIYLIFNLLQIIRTEQRSHIGYKVPLRLAMQDDVGCIIMLRFYVGWNLVLFCQCHIFLRLIVPVGTKHQS